MRVHADSYPPRRTPLDLETPCIIWPGHVNQFGYGKVTIDSQEKFVHRLAYQLHVGLIPRGWEIDHVCHSSAIADGRCHPGVCPHRSCYNPQHLEAVTSRENSFRGGHPLFAIAKSDVCRQGHSLTDETNVYVYPSGKRRCRTCIRQKARERHARLRGEARSDKFSYRPDPIHSIVTERLQ